MDDISEKAKTELSHVLKDIRTAVGQLRCV
jgi:hypothetical protein